MKKLKIQEPSCLLKTADFKTLLNDVPAGTADLILTDPPYSISKKTGFKNLGKNSVERFAISMDFGKWDHTEINLDDFSKLSYKALKQGGTIICFYDLWKITKVQSAFIKAGFKMIRLIIWEKTNPVPLNSKSIYLSNSREVAVLGSKSTESQHLIANMIMGFMSFPIHREKGMHPTQKPLQLMEKLIEAKHSKTNGDSGNRPISMGSGTTGLSWNKIKEARFIGGDKDSNYIEKAKQTDC